MMENQGFNSGVKNQCPSQPVGQPYPPPGYDGQPQPVGQPYPPPGYDGQPQPGFNYPSPPPYNTDVQPNGFPQQAQPQVFYIQAPAYIAQAPNVVSMHVAIVLSCFVLWLCGMIFGLIAFVIALVGENASAGGDTVRAIRLRNASYGVSIAGCVAGVSVIIVFAILLLH